MPHLQAGDALVCSFRHLNFQMASGEHVCVSVAQLTIPGVWSEEESLSITVVSIKPASPGRVILCGRLRDLTETWRVVSYRDRVKEVG